MGNSFSLAWCLIDRFLFAAWCFCVVGKKTQVMWEKTALSLVNRRQWQGNVSLSPSLQGCQGHLVPSVVFPFDLGKEEHTWLLPLAESEDG